MPWSSDEGADLLKILAERHVEKPTWARRPRTAVPSPDINRSEPTPGPKADEAKALDPPEADVQSKSQPKASPSAGERLLESVLALFAAKTSGHNVDETTAQPQERNEESNRRGGDGSASGVASFLRALLDAASNPAPAGPGRGKRNLIAHAHANFGAGGSKRMKMLRVIAEELNQGNARFATQMLRGCIESAGGASAVSAATGVPLDVITRGVLETEAVSREFGRLLVLYLTAWKG